MHELSDTIAAIATASGQGGIAIVRISGPGSLAIADRIFRGRRKPSSLPANRFVYGVIHSPAPGTEAGGNLDEAILLVYRGPHSYTREDVVEIQGHGGHLAARRVLRAALEAGARLAEPGEFTRRAFLNGRIDLLQAEAVADLIQAQSDRAAAAAIEQLEGSLSTTITKSYDSLMDVAGDLEASLDFAEGELPEATMRDISARLERAVEELAVTLKTWEEGRLLREGAIVVIAGKPNVGKSTLLNTLLGSRRAIVTEIPGTTRDTIEEQLVLGGFPIRLVDTAGLRHSDCRIEREGILRAQESAEKADLVLYMMDSSEPLDSKDLANVRKTGPSRCLVILNKTDKGQTLKAEALPDFTVVTCSLTKGEGTNDVRAAIVEKLGLRAEGQPHAVISERHRSCIRKAIASATEAVQMLESGQDDMLAIAATKVRNSATEIGSVLGRNYSNDLLDNIFRKFCVGK